MVYLLLRLGLMLLLGWHGLRSGILVLWRSRRYLLGVADIVDAVEGMVGTVEV